MQPTAQVVLNTAMPKLYDKITYDLPKRNFADALTAQDDVAIIAEYKRASPSMGDINLEISVEDVVKHYEQLGAKALSILTNRELFKGQLDFIPRAKLASSLPVLRKDFITTQKQVYESQLFGADAILLIVAKLSTLQLQELNKLALQLGLQTLIEAHTAEELATAIACQPTMVGINSRNLDTLKIDTNLFDQLANQVPEDVVLVAESGLQLTDLPHIKTLGFDAALMGTSLMQQFS